MSSNSTGERERIACNEFKPQDSNPDWCNSCSMIKEDHPKQILQKHVEGLKNEDPTEMFELLEMIGSGSYGYVFLARDIKTNHYFAIKFMELEKKHAEIRAIANEINIMKECFECPYIVEYQGCFTKSEYIMVVMEHCACSVEDILSYCAGEVTFTEQQIAAVCASTIKGIAYLHANGIAHRDIKSGNILLTNSGQAKLADFGVSHKLQNKRDKMKTLAGSPYWCAPELIFADSYDNKIDVWACGIVAIEMAENRPPHWDMDPMQVIFHIPKMPPPKLKEPEKWSADFSDFLEKCLRKNPDERPTAKELLSHPFILSGSSQQILGPIVAAAVPIVLPKKKAALSKEEEDEDEDEGEGESEERPETESDPEQPPPETKPKGGTHSRPTSFIKKGTVIEFDRNTHKANVVYARTKRTSQYQGAPGTPTGSVSKATGKRVIKKRFFGVSLTDSLRECSINQIPHIVDHTSSFLFEHATKTEGIFRTTGDFQKIKELKQRYEDGEIIDLTQYNVHDVASLFKIYLRELPECLLTAALYPSFLVAEQLEQGEGRKSMIKSLIEMLPVENQSVLHKIVILLAIISSYSAENGMNSAALARCFAPNILFSLQEDEEGRANDLPYLVKITQTLIEENSYFFPA